MISADFGKVCGNIGKLIRSKDSQVKTQLVLWIFILFKVTR